jgi:MFS family permease
MGAASLNHLQYNQLGLSDAALAVPGCLLAGLMLDRIGSQITIAIFTATTILGLTLQAYSVCALEEPSFGVLCLGRAIFGFGAKAVLVWFA